MSNQNLSATSVQTETQAAPTQTQKTTSTYWYTCKYAPVEMLAGFGLDSDVVKKTPNLFDDAEALVGPRMCGFSKALIQTVMDGNISHLLLSDCCNAMQRSYDAINALGDCDTLDMLEVPHCGDECTRERFAKDLKTYAHTLEERTGRTLDLEKCKQACTQMKRPTTPYIGLIGVRTPVWLFDLAREALPLPLVDLTCAGLRDINTEVIDFSGEDAFFTTYANALLDQTPCARMANDRDRAHLFDDPHLKAVVYHTARFCDFYDIECAERQTIGGVPILHIEEDFTHQSEGQMRTRIEAFAEQLRGLGIGSDEMRGILKEDETANSSAQTAGQSPAGSSANSSSSAASSNGKFTKNEAADRNSDLVAGIDSGSTSTDVIIMDADANIVASAILPTQGSATKSAEASLNEALQAAYIPRDRVKKVIATGYGRDAISSQGNITEITCHAKGAHYLDPNVRLVIDIGGQDSKAIALDGNGAVKEFAMNDKCAAGTGRFLEMMATTLGIPLSEMAELGDKGAQTTTITSTCSVFAESEVVSLVAQDVPVADIVSAIDRSVAKRVCGLARRVGISDTVMMTGGVTKNTSVVHAIEHTLGRHVETDPKAQLCGAIGAALSALDR